MRKSPSFRSNIGYYKSLILCVLVVIASVLYALLLRGIFDFFSADLGNIVTLALFWVGAFASQFMLYALMAILVKDWRVTLIPAILSAVAYSWVFEWTVISQLLAAFYVIAVLFYSLSVYRDVEDRIHFSFSSLTKGKTALCISMIAFLALSSYQGIMHSSQTEENFEVPHQAIEYITPIIQEKLGTLVNEMFDQFGQGVDVPEDKKQLIISESIERVQNIMVSSVNEKLPDPKYLYLAVLVFASLLLVPISRIFAFFAHLLTYLLLFILQKIGFVQKNEVTLEAERFEW